MANKHKKRCSRSCVVWKCKLDSNETAPPPCRRGQSPDTDTPCAGEDGGQQASHPLPGGCTLLQPLWGQFGCFLQNSKHFPHPISQSCFLVFTQSVENMATQNPTCEFCQFNNHQNGGAMPFGKRWMNEFCSIQTVEHCSALRRNELWSHEKRRRTLPCE